MKLRKEFVLKALAQEMPFRELCREFGISRKTGYKWLERFHERGFDGLVDQSTRPQNSPGRTTAEIAVEIIRLRQAHPTWGPKKIRKLLSKRLPLESELPSLRTISRVLARVHMLRPKKRRRPADQGWMLQAARKRVTRRSAERRVDGRLQRLVDDARRPPLRAADGTRRFQPLHPRAAHAAALRHRGRACGIRGALRETRRAEGDSERQRRAVRRRPQPRRPDEAFGVVDLARDRHRAQSSRLSAGQWRARADARRHQRRAPDARSAEHSCAAACVRRLARRVQPRPPARSARPGDARQTCTGRVLRRLMRARVGGFPDETEIVKLGAVRQVLARRPPSRLRLDVARRNAGRFAAHGRRARARVALPSARRPVPHRTRRWAQCDRFNRCPRRRQMPTGVTRRVPPEVTLRIWRRPQCHLLARLLGPARRSKSRLGVTLPPALRLRSPHRRKRRNQQRLRTR